MTTRHKIGATVCLAAAVVLAGYGIAWSELAWPYALGAVLGVRSRM